jgi:adenosine deaminase
MRWLTINAMKSSFLPFDERLELIEGVIKKGYEKLAAEG